VSVKLEVGETAFHIPAEIEAHIVGGEDPRDDYLFIGAVGTGPCVATASDAALRKLADLLAPYAMKKTWSEAGGCVIEELKQ
jgi:hypothetical protein